VIAMAQKSIQPELPFDRRGVASGIRRSGQARAATGADEHPGTVSLLELALERENLLRVLKRVRQDKDSSGVDEMTTDELPDYLRQEWPRLREEILAGRYEPQPVRRHLIDKPRGGTRELGIPTVLDRFIQQALLQILQPIFDPTFSEHSHGFRPGRRAHDAVRQAQRHVQDGRRWVVERHEGTPQGGSLSPLLANWTRWTRSLSVVGMRSSAMRTICGCTSGQGRPGNA